MKTDRDLIYIWPKIKDFLEHLDSNRPGDPEISLRVMELTDALLNEIKWEYRELPVGFKNPLESPPNDMPLYRETEERLIELETYMLNHSAAVSAG